MYDYEEKINLSSGHFSEPSDFKKEDSVSSISDLDKQNNVGRQ